MRADLALQLLDAPARAEHRDEVSPGRRAPHGDPLAVESRQVETALVALLPFLYITFLDSDLYNKYN